MTDEKKVKFYKEPDTYIRIDLNPDDYSQTVYPGIIKLREALIELYGDTKSIDRHLAFVVYPQFLDLQKKIDRLERTLYNRFMDEESPVP